ncbi:hypothetical protein AB0G02_10965, partial [Actinosynnema sp. NPDC023658]|uniref:hypothetical protein n=1 Tax=Actinosynnema sp. NPDC023658 TaxID=3155465 RepID=UPI0033C36C1B
MGGRADRAIVGGGGHVADPTRRLPAVRRVRSAVFCANPPRRGRSAGILGTMKPRLALVLAVGSALVLIALAARGTSPVRYGEPAAGVDVELPAITRSAPPLDTAVDSSPAAGSLLVLMILLAAAAVVGVVWLFVSLGLFRRRRRRRGVGPAVDAPELPEEH